MMILVTGTVT